MDWEEVEKKLDKIYAGEKCGDEIEGEFLEVKHCPKNFMSLIQKCRKMAVCFGNSNGGTFVLGVEDKIKGPEAFTGCPDFNVWDIAKEVREGTKKPVHVRVEYHSYKGIELIEVKVPKGPFEGAHSLTDGRQYKRAGADCLPMYAEYVSPKFRQPEQQDYSRSIVDGITIDDLDKNEINIVKKVIQSIDPSSDFLQLTDDIDLLKSLGMLEEKDDGELDITLAGLLFVGEKSVIANNVPESEMVFLAYDKNDREDIERRYSGGLLSIVMDFQDFYNKNFNDIHHVDTGLFELKIPKIPDKVLREALLNAITHREYRVPSSIFFKHYSDRIELVNPGDFMGDITPNNILHHSPVWRNRLISEIFQRIGLVRRSGIGVDRMYHYLLYMGKEPPIYNDESYEVTLTIYDNIDEGFAEYLHKLEIDNKPLPLDEMIILSKLKSSDRIYTKEVSKILQRSIEESKNVLNRMYHKRLLDRHGATRGTYYRLSNKMYREFGDSIGYIRNGDIEKRKQKELILQTLRERYRISNKEAQDLLALDKNQAYRILNELREEGMIVMKGRGRGAFYIRKDFKIS